MQKFLKILKMIPDYLIRAAHVIEHLFCEEDCYAEDL